MATERPQTLIPTPTPARSQALETPVAQHEKTRVIATANVDTDTLFAASAVVRAIADSKCGQKKRLVVLVQEWFVPSRTDRAAELEQTLRWNVTNPHIDCIVLACGCVEDELALRLITETFNITNRKKIVVARSQRLTFRTAFDLVNQLVPTGHVAIVANADISFDYTLANIHHMTLENTCLALLRYDIPTATPTASVNGVSASPVDTGNENRSVVLRNRAKLFVQHVCDSQDTWVFRTPIRVPSIETGLDFNYCFGTPACDNVLAFQLSELGYAVINACVAVKTFHLHDVQTRTPYAMPPLVENAKKRRQYAFLFPALVSLDTWTGSISEWHALREVTNSALADIGDDDMKNARQWLECFKNDYNAIQLDSIDEFKQILTRHT
jgi:hypothetical protein